MEDLFILLCTEGKLNEIKELLRTKWINIHAGGEEAFRSAYMYGRLEVVRYLTSLHRTDDMYTRIDIHAMNEDAFRSACEHSCLDVVRYLTTLHRTDDTYKRIDIHVSDEMAFISACRNGNIQIACYLASLHHMIDTYNMIDIHALNEDAFKQACWNTHIKMIRYLLSLYRLDTYNIIYINHTIPYSIKLIIIKYCLKHKIYDDSHMNTHVIYGIYIVTSIAYHTRQLSKMLML